MLDIFINIAASPENSICASVANPVAQKMPAISAGDTIPARVYICDGDDDYFDPTGYTCKIAIGNRGETPAYLETGTAITNGFRFDISTARDEIIALFAVNPGIPVQVWFEVKIYDALNNPRTIASVPLTILPNVFDDTASDGNATGITGATLPLVNGANVSLAENVVTVSGLTWNEAPSQVFVIINIPSGSVTMIAANVIAPSISATGFQFVMSTVPDNSSYTFTYIPIP